MVHIVRTRSSSGKSGINAASLNPGMSAAAGLGSFEKLNGFFNAIYDGPTEDPPWHTVLDLLCETLDAKHVTLILRPPSPVSTGILVNTDSAATDATEAYQNHFFTLDPFMGLPEGEIVTPEELVGAKAWKEGTLYRDYLKPLDVKYLIGADIHTPDGIECRFRVSRGGDSLPFSDDDKALCRLLLPHMRRALQLHSRLDGLETERQFFAGAVNRMQVGTISLAPNGGVIDLNPEARRILAQKDGIQFSNNVICVDNRREGQEFHRLIKDALSGHASKKAGLVEALALTRPSGHASLGVVVREIPPSPWTVNRQRPAAVVFIRDPEAGVAESSQKIVQQLFGLTRIEAAMALSLANGNTIEETADNLGLKKNTARTYLRFIFNKTGVTRQTMLVRKLLGSVVSLG